MTAPTHAAPGAQEPASAESITKKLREWRSPRKGQTLLAVLRRTYAAYCEKTYDCSMTDTEAALSLIESITKNAPPATAAPANLLPQGEVARPVPTAICEFCLVGNHYECGTEAVPGDVCACRENICAAAYDAQRDAIAAALTLPPKTADGWPDDVEVGKNVKLEEDGLPVDVPAEGEAVAPSAPEERTCAEEGCVLEDGHKGVCKGMDAALECEDCGRSHAECDRAHLKALGFQHTDEECLSLAIARLRAEAAATEKLLAEMKKDAEEADKSLAHALDVTGHKACIEEIEKAFHETLDQSLDRAEKAEKKLAERDAEAATQTARVAELEKVWLPMPGYALKCAVCGYVLNSDAEAAHPKTCPIGYMESIREGFKAAAASLEKQLSEANGFLAAAKEERDRWRARYGDAADRLHDATTRPQAAIDAAIKWLSEVDHEADSNRRSDEYTLINDLVTEINGARCVAQGFVNGVENTANGKVLLLEKRLAEVTRERDEARDTVKSISSMLGWGNVPPRDTLERDIRAKRAAYEFERNGRLAAEARLAEQKASEEDLLWAAHDNYQEIKADLQVARDQLAALAEHNKTLVEALEKSRTTLSWAIDLINMYDEFLLVLGEPREKVFSDAHCAGKKDAADVLAVVENVISKARIDAALSGAPSALGEHK